MLFYLQVGGDLLLCTLDAVALKIARKKVSFALSSWGPGAFAANVYKLPSL